MILLDATTRKLQIVLAAAKTSNDSPWVASYVDISQTTFGMTGASSATGASNGVTAVDTVAAPAASTTRQLKYFSLLNADTVAITVTVRYNDNATVRNMVTFIIPVGASLVYNAESGWVVQSYARGQILGTATNDDATAGNVGEYITSTVLAGSEVALTTNTAANITNISLTPGDWNVFGSVAIDPAGTTSTTLARGWISSASATQPTEPNAGGSFRLQGISMTGGQILMPVGPQRFSLAATTTVYLSCLALFTVSTNFAFGFIGARRVR